MAPTSLGVELVTCTSFRDRTLDLSAARLAAAAEGDLDRHALHCEACEAWWHEQRAAAAALTVLTRALEREVPDERLEPPLRAAYRRVQAGPPPAPRARRWPPAWAAAAAALGVAASLWWDRVPVANETPAAWPAGDMVVSLRSGEPSGSLEGGHIVRVRLSGPALVALGIPLDEPRRVAAVEADMLIGYDGVARAVRLPAQITQ